ncbi:S1 RNA-binding domain-containing protein [Candidatus Shapirobacteria bacterium]|nr:S1 RNA-binding domain-containing protein [Candidatus Shapirobacteria bacterium]
MKKTIKKAAKQKKASSKASSVSVNKKKVSSPKTETMEELLKTYAWQGFKRGDVIEGTVTEKSNQAVWVDIGAKTEGLLLTKEMKTAKDFIHNLKSGDKVTVTVFQAESDHGYPLLSFKKTLNDFLWSDFEEKLKSGEPIKVKGKEINKGGLVVDVSGFIGFIPTSCFGSKTVNKIKDLINQDLTAKIIEVDKEKNRLILSEKEISDQKLIEKQKEVLKKIKVGQKFEGKVSGIMPFGLFVKIKEDSPLEGLVHISEISWEKVDDPSKFYKQGDKVKVQVLLVDENNGKLNLTMKQLEKDPWVEIEKKYPVESKVKGEVTRVAPFGAFVLLDKGVEGLIHSSKLPAEKILKVGEKVDCFVESIDKKNRKMSLGLVLKAKPVGYK